MGHTVSKQCDIMAPSCIIHISNNALFLGHSSGIGIDIPFVGHYIKDTPYSIPTTNLGLAIDFEVHCGIK